jgi:hypothetical protein
MLSTAKSAFPFIEDQTLVKAHTERKGPAKKLPGLFHFCRANQLLLGSRCPAAPASRFLLRLLFAGFLDQRFA